MWFLVLAFIVYGASPAAAAVEPKAKVISLLGTVTSKESESAKPEKLLRKQELAAGAIIETGEKSFVKLELPDQTTMQIGAMSRVKLETLSSEQSMVVELQAGDSRVATTGLSPNDVQIKTPGGSLTAPGAKNKTSNSPTPETSLVAATATVPPPPTAASQFIARPQQFENIGSTPLRVLTPEGTSLQLASGYSLKQGAQPQAIPAAKLALYQQNPEQLAPTLSPLEAPQQSPLLVFTEAVQLRSAAEETSLPPSSPLDSMLVGSDEEQLREFAATAAMQDSSAQILELDMVVHERVVSQQAARAAREASDEGVPGNGTRSVSLRITYQ